MRPTLVVAVSLALAALACRDARRDQPSTAPAAAPLPRADAPAPDPTMRTLAGRLAFEAANRPGDGPRLETLIAAATAAGVEILDTRQYLGLTASAAYCAGGRTRDGLAVAVCEYADEPAAIAGRAHVERRFGSMGDVRRIVVRRSATLTTTGDAVAHARTRAALEQAFATL